MTATVTPPMGESALTGTDPSMRLNYYIEAFKYYLSDQITAIDGIILSIIPIIHWKKLDR